MKLAGSWGVRHITRCITVYCVKCYNRDMDKMLRITEEGLTKQFIAMFLSRPSKSLNTSFEDAVVRGDISHNLFWT